MSKVDAQRAMRDARYAAYQARKDSAGEAVTPAPAATPRKAAPRPVTTTAPSAQPDSSDPGDGSEAITAPDALCGHRSIGNKSCTRPAGHAEKSHRYG